jgi:UDP-N-acetylglucosamine diphosphorylase/glucosamine-1-phosphate N-acetyltransferase
MLRINLHDNGQHLTFAPLTLTRPVGGLRIGILTNEERWKLVSTTSEIGFTTEDYLQKRFPKLEDAIELNACILATPALANELINLENNTMLVQDNLWIATKGTGETKKQYSSEPLIWLTARWELYAKNHEALHLDYALVTKNRISQKLSETNRLIGPSELLFIEEGAIVEGATINTKSGPVYIGKQAEVMEGTLIRGALALCEHASLKLGTKIYGATTIGPYCKVGGEVNNVIFQSYSNKGHDGFLGNSMIGEWCNLGADTNTSNLKNNYGNVSTYSYTSSKEIETNMQFMGLAMGDHSKCGINTMFNTATVVGVSCNIFGSDFPAKYVPSFSWGGTACVPFKFSKAIEFANNMMNRRGLQLTQEEIEILAFIESSKTH